MQFSCNQDTFAKYLNIVSRVVSAKPGLPILNNILLDAEKGKLNMVATDLEIGINTWIGAEVKGSGRITVPAKQIAEFVNSIPSEKIDVSLDKQSLSVSTLNNSAEFHTIPADDYPQVASVGKEKPLLKISKEDILGAINRVAFAAAADDIKPVLTAIRIELSGDSIAFVSADGLRLSRQSIKLSSSVKEDITLLVPVKAMQELAFVLNETGEKDKESVEMYVIEERNQVVFRFNEIDIISRLIDGQYPEYKQIIPTGFKTQTIVNRAEFLNSLKVTNIIARTVLGNKIILDLDPKKKTIKLSASQSDVGSNESVFNAQIEGDAIKMAFSARFLGDMLNNIDGEELVFECSEPVKPGVFKIKGDDDFIHLIMPMML
jgi:DNA polymerase-3 subunit beta